MCENDRPVISHGLDPGKRFNTVTLSAKFRTAALKFLFNGDAATDHRTARLFGKSDKAFESCAGGEKIVDDQHTVLRMKIFPGNDNVTDCLVGEGRDLHGIDILRDIYGFAFLSK